MPLRVTGSDGRPADPQVAVTPIAIQLQPGLLQVVGTGFYVSRYGLLLTAAHLVHDIANHDRQRNPTLTWLWRMDGTLSLRPLRTCSTFHDAPRDAADIAICQAVVFENGAVLWGDPNERIAITTQVPHPGTRVATYAYPDNREVDFRNAEKTATIFADAFEGEVLAHIGPHERLLRYPHVETSIQIRAGASGGPVFAPRGHAFAVNCRGWDLAAAEDHLSSVVPISLALDMPFDFPHLPPNSGEFNSVPPERLGTRVTLRDLAAWGHVRIY
jgi:Trypsin-like peptidase domain